MGALELVAEFHSAFDIPVLDRPTLPEPERRALRERLLKEELDEFIEANKNGDLIEAVDAIIDLLYVLYGTALEYGIKTKPLFHEVHRSNMSKLGADGKPLRREDGKVLKGPNFFKPNILEVLLNQGMCDDPE